MSTELSQPGTASERDARRFPARSPVLSLLVVGLLTTPVNSEELLRDISAASGVGALVHVNGARGKKHLPETLGGGGWIDFDGDGRLDLYLVQAHSDSETSALPGDTANRLLRNTGAKTFIEVPDAAGADDHGFGVGLAVGDIDNDGDTDLFVTNFGRNSLYRNDGGHFVDITERAKVGGSHWSASACFADVNGDGLLDLYVTNYLVYDPRIHKACTGNTNRVPSYCHPNKYDGAPDELHLNRGEGRFENITLAAGVGLSGRILAKGLGVLPTDFDEDGDIDFLVANDSVPNFLWRNLGDGKFEDAALEAGVALNSSGRPEACMGVDGGDVNGDGRQDYYITNFSEETDTLYLGEGDGFFDDGTFRAGLGTLTYSPLGFGVRLFDQDLDGDLDVYIARGHILDNLDALYPGKNLTHAQPDQLLHGDGRGHFEDVSARASAWFRTARVGRAAATADFDDDGDLDLFIVNNGGPSTLLENLAADEKTRSWIGLRLVGTGRSNRDAYGSRVKITTDDETTRHFEVRSAMSYAASNDARVHTGLAGRSVKEIEVRWPDGRVERFGALAAGAYHTLTEGTGARD